VLIWAPRHEDVVENGGITPSILVWIVSKLSQFNKERQKSKRHNFMNIVTCVRTRLNSECWGTNAYHSVTYTPTANQSCNKNGSHVFEYGVRTFSRGNVYDCVSFIADTNLSWTKRSNSTGTTVNSCIMIMSLYFVTLSLYRSVWNKSYEY